MVLLSGLLLCCNTISAQTWFANKNKWFYGVNAGANTFVGTNRLRVISDTSINNILFKKIEETYFDASNNPRGTSHYYLSESGGIVLQYSAQRIDTIYNFQLKEQDTLIWNIFTQEMGNCSHKITIDSLGTRNIIDEELKVQFATMSTDDGPIKIQIIEKIGWVGSQVDRTKIYYSDFSYLIPSGIFDCTIHGMDKGSLCYYEEEGKQSVNFPQAGNNYCDMLVETQSLQANDGNIFPNPTGNSLFINNPKFTASDIIEIYNAQGQKVDSRPFVQEIDVSHFPSGMYYLVIRSIEHKSYVIHSIVKK